jgi:hypothetical protein
VEAPQRRTGMPRGEKQRQEAARRITEQVGRRAPAELAAAIEALLAGAKASQPEPVHGYMLDSTFTVPIRVYDVESGGQRRRVYSMAILGYHRILRRHLLSGAPRPTWPEAQVSIRGPVITIRFAADGKVAERFDAPGVPFSTRIAASILRRSDLVALQDQCRGRPRAGRGTPPARAGTRPFASHRCSLAGVAAVPLLRPRRTGDRAGRAASPDDTGQR